jgi:hypothetical protein
LSVGIYCAAIADNHAVGGNRNNRSALNIPTTTTAAAFGILATTATSGNRKILNAAQRIT